MVGDSPEQKDISNKARKPMSIKDKLASGYRYYNALELRAVMRSVKGSHIRRQAAKCIDIRVDVDNKFFGAQRKRHGNDVVATRSYGNG
jgi:hypothetical protein